MKTGKTPSPLVLDNGTLFSYALNNHWFTNFFARQGGDFTFRFRLLSARESDEAELGRAGREMLTPFAVGRIGVSSARGPGVEILRDPGAPAESTRSFAPLPEGSASLETLKPARDGDGFILRLQDMSGRAGRALLRLNWPWPVRLTLCDILERPCEELMLADGEVSVSLKPFGTATLRVRPAVPGP